MESEFMIVYGGCYHMRRIISDSMHIFGWRFLYNFSGILHILTDNQLYHSSKQVMFAMGFLAFTADDEHFTPLRGEMKRIFKAADMDRCGNPGALSPKIIKDLQSISKHARFMGGDVNIFRHVLWYKLYDVSSAFVLIVLKQCRNMIILWLRCLLFWYASSARAEQGLSLKATRQKMDVSGMEPSHSRTEEWLKSLTCSVQIATCSEKRSQQILNRNFALM